mgnify:CR=1 FL=1
MFAFLFGGAPFCTESDVQIVNGEIFYFEFIVAVDDNFDFNIDQILPFSLTVAQSHNVEMAIDQDLLLDFNIDKIQNSEFLR